MSIARIKFIAILGPTSAGKSSLGVFLAKRFKGEIVSADSRQIYKGMDIGTGKITKKEMKGIPHYLLDTASPKRKFTAFQYKAEAEKKIEKISKKGKLPFLVGGSPFYAYSVIEGWNFPELKPDWKLRKELDKKSASELFSMIKKLDPKRAGKIDKKNKRRIIRAIEIFKSKGRILPLEPEPKFDCLVIGIKLSPELLKKKIKARLLKRLKQGMVQEVKNLKKSGLSWKRLEEFGLEYRWLSRYIQKKISFKEATERLQKDIEKFAKRQMTWFKRDERIVWVKDKKEAEKEIKKFLKK
jgi:tRNA dimethylallyltransferase